MKARAGDFSRPFSMTSEKAWTMFELVLFSPALSPIGILIAILAYPWRTRPWEPYVWIMIALSLPLLCMLALQALSLFRPDPAKNDP